MRRGASGGSALLMALWTIAVLSVMVLAFSVEANLQGGVNFYVRERSRVDRLVDSGKAIAELVLVNYQDVSEWESGEDTEKIIREDDRWLREKRALKTESRCTIGPILLDERRNPDYSFVNPATVKVEIEVDGGGSGGAININDLYEGGSDKNYRLRWQMMLWSHGIDPELEAKDDEGRNVPLADWLIACWSDWRDDNDDVTQIGGIDGAEKKWYEDFYEENRIDEEDRYYPRNGSVPDVAELSYVRGFREYPAVLTGGLLDPKEKESEDNPVVRGVIHMFGVTGNTKVNPNLCSEDELLTVPGIFDEDDLEEGKARVAAILEGLGVMPEDDTSVDPDRKTWPYKNFDDLRNRVDEDIGDEAREYLVFTPQEDSIFKVKITGESLGMTREVSAKCYVSDKKVRYIEWRED